LIPTHQRWQLDQHWIFLVRLLHSIKARFLDLNTRPRDDGICVSQRRLDVSSRSQEISNFELCTSPEAAFLSTHTYRPDFKIVGTVDLEAQVSSGNDRKFQGDVIKTCISILWMGNGKRNKVLKYNKLEKSLSPGKTNSRGRNVHNRQQFWRVARQPCTKMIHSLIWRSCGCDSITAKLSVDKLYSTTDSACQWNISRQQ
jgi:hypothetical protein